jgi:glycosyltransferase involved in cell wall biosynthesis
MEQLGAQRVAILLSTYNGQRFLSVQLDSLLRQTYPKISICIRDDGSSDNTRDVIKTYEEKFADKVNLLQDELGHVGVYRSFRTLIGKCSADYYLFCDQDDIWDQNKVDILVQEINALGEKYSSKSPCLICSDYRIINEANELIVPSAFKEYGLKHKELVAGLFQGFVPGCTMIFNKPARKLFLKYDGFELHDNQILILTAIFGQIGFCSVQSMSYRVHSRNAIGLRERTSKIILLKDLMKFIFNSEQYRRIILRRYFEMRLQLARQIRVSLLKERELFSSAEIDEMGYCRRKKWFLDHFKPFHLSKVEGLIQLILF